MDTIHKTFRAVVKEANESDGIIDLMIPISSDKMDRDGEIIEPTAFKKSIPQFMKHPVLVASHDYHDLTNQIGEWTKLKVEDGGVNGKPKYYINAGNEQADWAYYLASKGVAAFSVGFIPKVWEDGKDEKAPRRTYKEVELLEISQVIVPSNRQAVQNMRSKSVDPVVLELCNEVEKELVTKPEETDDLIHIPVKDAGQFQPDSFRTIDIDKEQGIKAVIGKLKGETKTTVQKYMFDKSKGWTMSKAQAWVKEHEGKTFEDSEIKSVIPYHKYPLDESGEWDAAREVAKADVEDLKKMCTLIVGDPENKTSYKLPHHKADGYATVWRGVAAAGAVLMGARGGVDAPASDITGAKAHLFSHYKEFDKEPPWGKGVSQKEIMDEIDYLKSLIAKVGLSAEAAKSLGEIKQGMAQMRRIHDMMADCEDKAGKAKVMSAEMMEDMEDKSAMSQMQEMHDMMAACEDKAGKAKKMSEDMMDEDKSLAQKAGAVLNKKNKDRLAQIKKLAQEVLDSAGIEEEEEKRSPGYDNAREEKENITITEILAEIQNITF